MNVVRRALDKRPDPGVPASDWRTDDAGWDSGKEKQSGARELPLFPNRASWLKDQMLKRGWSTADPSKYGGPDRKTVEKILRGEGVRNEVLEKLADALSKKQGKISVIDVPQDSFTGFPRTFPHFPNYSPGKSPTFPCVASQSKGVPTRDNKDYKVTESQTIETPITSMAWRIASFSAGKDSDKATDAR